jgi:hypothetical protein
MVEMVGFEVGVSFGVVCANLIWCFWLGVLLCVSVLLFCPLFCCVSMLFEVH